MVTNSSAGSFLNISNKSLAVGRSSGSGAQHDLISFSNGGQIPFPSNSGLLPSVTVRIKTTAIQAVSKIEREKQRNEKRKGNIYVIILQRDSGQQKFHIIQ